MSKVLCFDACSVLRCPLLPSENSLKIIAGDINKFNLPVDTHVYLLIEADGIREEVRFSGGSNFSGVMTVERGDYRYMFPAGASVCVAITCGYLNDFVCQRVTECAQEVAPILGSILTTNNNWTGNNTFTKSTWFGSAKWNPELTAESKLLSVNSGLWVNFSTAIDKEQYGYLATITRTAGNKPTLGAKFQARAEAAATEFVRGSTSEAWTAPGSLAPLYGAASIIYSQESNSPAEKVGHVSVFRNRPQDTSNTVSGLGANKYNQASMAYAVLSQTRSSAGEFCGWSRGLVFGADSLDEAAGVKAIGIDFSDLVTANMSRVDSLVRLKYDGAVEWNGDSVTYDSLKSTFNRTAGLWGFTWKGNSRFGFRADNGTLIFADTGATTPLLVTAAGAASGQFLPVEVNGTIYKIELRTVS